jgi:uncharacterized protein (UPF0335 family)
MTMTEESPGIGHNKKTDARLKSIIERVERLESERKDLGADIREIYSEAKGAGFEPRILRKIIAIRKMDANARAEQEALLETYLTALGME